MTHPNPQPTTSRPPTAAPAAPPKLTDEQMRLECVKLAVQVGVSPAILIETSKQILDFVKRSV